MSRKITLKRKKCSRKT